MAVIYELHGRAANFPSLDSTCILGVPSAVGTASPWLHRMTLEKWTTVAQPRKNILFELKRDAKRMEGDPRES